MQRSIGILTANLEPFFRDRLRSAVLDVTNTMLRMAYDEALADRTRTLLREIKGLSEKRMFGGLAFLINGHMSVCVSSQGGLMVRIEPSETEKFLERPHTREMVMRGRSMNGWIRVDPDGLRSKRQLEQWVEREQPMPRRCHQRRNSLVQCLCDRLRSGLATLRDATTLNETAA